MMHMIDEPGTQAAVRQHDARHALQRELRRQDGDAVPRHQRGDVERAGAVGGNASAACRASRSIRSSTSAARRGFGKFYTYTDTTNTTPTADFVTLGHRSARTTRCCSSGRRRIRRPRPTTAARRASCSGAAQPFGNHNGGADRVQPAREAGHAGLRPALRRLRRRRQRRRSAQPRAEPELGVRQDPAHRSARHEQRERQVRHSGRATRSSSDEAGHARRDLRVRRAQPAALLVGCEDRQACISPTSGRTSVEEISPVTAGANLGWNMWEGSFRM